MLDPVDDRAGRVDLAALLVHLMPVATSTLSSLHALTFDERAIPLAILSGDEYQRVNPPQLEKYQGIADDPLDPNDPAFAALVQITSLGVTRWSDTEAGRVVRILLDADKIDSVATQLDVDPTALAVCVTVHELAHAVRRHDDDTSGPHSRLAESDAQRDTWSALTALLNQARWADLARRALAAMIALATRQPAPYTTFGRYDPVRYSARSAVRRAWAGSFPVDAADLVDAPVVHVPATADHDVVGIGDLLWVRGALDAAAGPFLVVDASVTTTTWMATDDPYLVLVRTDGFAVTGACDHLAFANKPTALTNDTERELRAQIDQPVPDDAAAFAAAVYTAAEGEIRQQFGMC